MKLELAPVLELLHSVHASTLATQSLQMAGYPYATVVPNVLDEQHRPILLISALAEHTKNLVANPKVSISVTESGISNVQDGRRLTLVGDAEQFDASEGLKARYLRYQPAAEQYLMLDFMFFRILPKRLRYIGGVGRMGWVESEVLDLAPMDPKQGLIVAYAHGPERFVIRFDEPSAPHANMLNTNLWVDFSGATPRLFDNVK